MIQQKDVFQKDGKNYIILCPAEVNTMGLVWQGEKQKCLLYKNGIIKPVIWDRITDIEENKCIGLNISEELIPSSELAYSFREHGSERLQELAAAFEILPLEFLPINKGILPLSSFYFLKEDGILFLPNQLANIIDIVAEDSFRYEDRQAWMVPNVAESFAKNFFLCELAYYSISGGIIPYASTNVREDGFKAVPLTLIAPSREATFIQNALEMNLNKQQKVGSDYHWFMKGISGDFAQCGKSEKEKLDEFLSKQKKRAKVKRFFRRHGLIVMILTVVVVAGSIFLTKYVQRFSAPPTTAGMNAEDVIRSYFKAQTNLDVTLLTESLANGAKSPVEMEVTNLYVTRQMRQAYESVSAIVPADQWIAEGMPDLPTTFFVYGISSCQITQLSQKTYQAETTLITNSNYFSSDDVELTFDDPMQKTGVDLYVYKQVQEFDIGNKKDWLVITEIRQVDFELVEVLFVPYYSATK